MYLIEGLAHRTDISLGAHGFYIDLSPEFRDAVRDSRITADNIQAMKQNCSQDWLRVGGYSARSLFSVDITWGEWGPEHISVPGNATGLDIDRDPCGCFYPYGARLVPHNVDCWSQKYMLLVIFTEIASTIAYGAWDERDQRERAAQVVANLLTNAP